MSPVPLLATYAELRRSQWLDRERLQALQRAKLRAILRHAYATVPFYRRRFDEAGIRPDDIRSAEDLVHLPVTTKADLQAAGKEMIVSHDFAARQLKWELTSGSTGQPLSTAFDRHFVAVRDALFLRALGTAGYRFGDRLLRITSAAGKRRRPWLRWRYLSVQHTSEEMLAEVLRFPPGVIYGSVSPLRQLASLILESGRQIRPPRAIVTTAEALDDFGRDLLRNAFGAEVYDVYGLTETGLIACECPEHAGYHVAEDTAVLELVPAADEARLVVTNLELRAMPMIRFETGDIGVAGPAEPCGCGRQLRRLARIEGRIVDALRMPDGRTISPYRLTLAMRGIPGLRRFQVIQERHDAFILRIETQQAAEGDVAAAGRKALADVVGSGACIDVRNEVDLSPPPGRKFRVVECRLSRSGQR